MSGQNGLVKLDQQVAVLEERMNTITESNDRGWKLIEAKMGEATAGMREDNARRDTEFAKLREDSAKRDRNIAIQIYAVGFGILIVIIGIGGTIISLLI